MALAYAAGSNTPRKPQDNGKRRCSRRSARALGRWRFALQQVLEPVEGPPSKIIAAIIILPLRKSRRQEDSNRRPHAPDFPKE